MDLLGEYAKRSGGRRVIYGDLTVKDVDPGKVAK